MLKLDQWSQSRDSLYLKVGEELEVKDDRGKVR